VLFAFASVCRGFTPADPTRGHRPLDPIRGVFFLPHPEGVQRVFAPLQVQEVARAFSRLQAFAGVSPLQTPQGDIVPLTPFGTFFLTSS
jgi:hypothetical protein